MALNGCGLLSKQQERIDIMKRTVILNFPDDFQFPKEFDHEHCKPCPFFQEDDELEEYDCCFVPAGSYSCPFYGKSENEEIEI